MELGALGTKKAPPKRFEALPVLTVSPKYVEVCGIVVGCLFFPTSLCVATTKNRNHIVFILVMVLAGNRGHEVSFQCRSVKSARAEALEIPVPSSAPSDTAITTKNKTHLIFTLALRAVI